MKPLLSFKNPNFQVGRPRDLRDRVEWLSERGRFEEALHTAESQVPAQPELCDKVRARPPL